MIEISYKQFHDQDFRRVIQKLSQTPVKSPLAFRLKEVVKKLSQADETVKEDFKKTFGGTFFQLDGQGNFLPDKTPIGLKLQEGKTFAEFQEAEKEFNNRKIQVNAKKLTSRTIGEAIENWSASELIALEPIYVELDEAKEA